MKLLNRFSTQHDVQVLIKHTFSFYSFLGTSPRFNLPSEGSQAVLDRNGVLAILRPSCGSVTWALCVERQKLNPIPRITHNKLDEEKKDNHPNIEPTPNLQRTPP
jgi:hypothetical protein